MKKYVLDSFVTAQSTLKAFMENCENIEKVNKLVTTLVECFKNGNKVLSCGNGGSMCDASHFAEEWTGRFRKDRIPLAALALSEPSHITCTANDYGFEYIFSRQVEALGKENDVLIGISTSGNSPNVINAVEVAKNKKMYTVGLLGKDGGKLKSICDLPIIVEADTSDRIQEMHIKIIHITIECVERVLFPELY